MKDKKTLRKFERILITIIILCLLAGTACQAGSSSTVGDNGIQAPITPTPTAPPPAAQPTPTSPPPVIFTEEITGTETPVIETQVAPAVTLDSSINGQLPGKLAFVRENNLWLQHNGVEQQLTTDGIPAEIPSSIGLSRRWYSDPQISPDGTKIAYLKSTNSSIRNLIVSDIEGQNVQQLANDVEGGIPIVRWSNDSQKIYYVSLQDGATKMVRSVNITTGEKQDHGQFTRMAECGGGSPDVADHLAVGENIIGMGSGVQIFELSPQNNYIVYTTACTGFGLRILDLATKQNKDLDGEARGAVISPDGLSIAAILGDDILIYEASSGEIKKRFPASGEPLVLLWGADGKTIFYSTFTPIKDLELETEVAFEYIGSAPASYRVNLSTLWSISLDTGKSEKVTDFNAHSMKPIFATDEKVLVVVVENAYALFDYISQQKPKENMVEYYPKVNIAEVDLASSTSNIVASKTRQAAYSIE